MGRSDKFVAIRAFAKRAPSFRLLLGDAHAYAQKDRLITLRHLSIGAFVLVVVVPTLITVAYFGFLASAQYQSESRFAIRSLRDRTLAGDIGLAKPAPSLASEYGKFGTGGKDSNSNLGSSQVAAVSQVASSTPKGAEDRQIAVDAYVVANFILSRNLVNALNQDRMLEDFYSAAEIDQISRLPRSGSSTALWSYWRGKVTPSIDTVSGIVTLRVVAFRPRDARIIAENVIRLTSDMVNNYSLRMRQDILKSAQRSLTEASDLYEKSLESLGSFRSLQASISPIESSNNVMTSLLELETERARVERDQWVTSKLTSPGSIPSQTYSDRVSSLTQQIEKLRSELTEQTNDAKSASVAIGKYRDLELERQFAERSYLTAQTAFEQARLEADYKGVALAVFQAPTSPEAPAFPRRLVNSCLVAGIGLIIWSILRLALATLEEYLILRTGTAVPSRRPII